MAGNALEVIAGIREQADMLVRRVNPGRDSASPAFAAKSREVAEVITRRLCLDLNDQDRPDLARKIRIAWESLT
jgi:hypothetical protein